MVISYQGIESFKVQFGDITISYNPVSKDSKFKATRFGADIALISTDHPDMNGADGAAFGDRVPFVIKGPGEYEVKEIYIKGFMSESEYGGKKKINIVYTVNMEGMNICFLGALSNPELTSETKEAIDGVDILFVPIGGEGVLDPASAYKLAVKLQPKIIIPMHYGEVGDKNALKMFLKEEGGENAKPVDKLTLKKKDLEGKEGEIVLISPNV